MTNLQILAIYFTNLSGFYICSFFVSIFAVLFTVYIMRFSSCFEKKKNQTVHKPLTKEQHLQEETFKKFFKDDNFFDSSDDEEKDDENKSGLVGKLKSAKLKAIEETLSDEQKVKEKEIEKEQLGQIFELLKQQEEEFKLSKMEEQDLKAQLNLYR